MVNFIVIKTKFFNHYKLNERQIKVALRMFNEGLEGFKGGLSAKNYQTITKASTATTTRDLQDLVALGAFTKQGVLKNSRYYLQLEL
jgi:Fic family protein